MTALIRAQAFAPGKLYLAGEYAVTEPGSAALLVAVNRGLTVTLTAAPKNTVSAAVYGAAPRSWQRVAAAVQVADAPYDYVTAALTVLEQLRELHGVAAQQLAIVITSNLNAASGEKYGLGSSGAVVAALVLAYTDFYALPVSREMQYRLALLASCTVSTAGSGGDIAASVFGGWISYRSPDRSALLEAYQSRGLAAALESSAWRSSAVIQLCPPTGVQLLVGWTGAPALTDEMLARAKAVQQLPWWRDFVAQSDACVVQLTQALGVQHDMQQTGQLQHKRVAQASVTARRQDTPAGCPAQLVQQQTALRQVLTGLQHAGQLLRQLSVAGGFTIETPRLEQLRQIAAAAGAVAKSSGAGGGDCGIALVTGLAQQRTIVAGWERAQIKHLDLEVYSRAQAAAQKGNGCGS